VNVIFVEGEATTSSLRYITMSDIKMLVEHSREDGKSYSPPNVGVIAHAINSELGLAHF
jgi:hypothetical protein